MSAKDYKLSVSALAGKVYIAKDSKRTKGAMTDDRVEVTKPEFLVAIMEWTAAQLKGDENVLSVTLEGEVVAEIHLMKKPKSVPKNGKLVENEPNN